MSGASVDMGPALISHCSDVTSPQPMASSQHSYSSWHVSWTSATCHVCLILGLKQMREKKNATFVLSRALE